MFPGTYTAAIMAGNGVAGILAVLIRIITKLSLPNTTGGLIIGACIYFGIAAFVNFLCIIGYIILNRLPITTYYMLKAGTTSETKQNLPSHRGSLNSEDDVEPLLANEVPEQKPSILHVFKKIWVHALTIGSVFIVTLGMYPGVTSLITHTQWKIDEDWYQILLIVCKFYYCYYFSTNFHFFLKIFFLFFYFFFLRDYLWLEIGLVERYLLIPVLLFLPPL
jgi:hypothetical protein